MIGNTHKCCKAINIPIYEKPAEIYLKQKIILFLIILSGNNSVLDL